MSLSRVFCALGSITFLFSLSSRGENGSEIIEQINKVQSSVSQAELSQRKLYADVLSSDSAVKKISEERSYNNDKVLKSEANAQEYAFKVRELEEKIKFQRKRIGKSVAQIYQLKNPGLLPFLFSDQSASEMEKNVRFLIKLSKRDFQRFKTYQKALRQARAARNQLKGEVKKLLTLREQLRKKENQLLTRQKSMSELMKKIRSNKEKNMELIKRLRSQLPELDQDIKVALFEKKGQLNPPLEIKPSQTYGSRFDPKYRVKLLHLGWSYENIPVVSEVKSIFSGKVAFVGSLPGFGSTIVLDHGNNYFSIYSHLNESLVFEGEEIFENQKIAMTHSQLYFEMRHFSNTVDPSKWFSQNETPQVAQTAVNINGETL